MLAASDETLYRLWPLEWLLPELPCDELPPLLRGAGALCRGALLLGRSRTTGGAILKEPPPPGAPKRCAWFGLEPKFCRAGAGDWLGVLPRAGAPKRCHPAWGLDDGRSLRCAWAVPAAPLRFTDG